MMLKKMYMINWQIVNNIDTNNFVLKAKYNTDKTELENKIPNETHFVKKSETHWIRKQNSAY